MQFKVCALFIYGVFHVMFLDHGWLPMTETAESKMIDKGGTTVIQV